MAIFRKGQNTTGFPAKYRTRGFMTYENLGNEKIMMILHWWI